MTENKGRADASNNGPSSEYTAADITVLGGREAVRRRPGMYIGSTDWRGLHHLVYEVVNNSVDEAMAGFCDRVVVVIHQSDYVSVSDNGRGIPVDIHKATKVSALQTVMTTLHAGAKFGGKIYQVSGGLHGVGASVVNALAAELTVEVRREGKRYQQHYKKGIVQGEVTEVGEDDGNGTTITFLPDPEIFSDSSCDFKVLTARLREMAYLNKDLEIKITDERRDEEKTFYFEGGVTGFVRHLNRNRNTRHRRPIYIQKQVNGTMVEVAIQYNDGFTESTYSFVNCINTVDGGTHLTGFRTALTRVFNDYAKKSNFLKEGETSLTGDDVREGLTAVINVKLPEPQFEGQTKGKLGNPEVKGQVESVLNEGLAVWFGEHPDDARKILEKCIMVSKAREAARKARDLVIRKSALDIAALPGKLADCSDKDPSKCEIFIVEGDSAGGSAKQGRDRRFQAILPLRGKILNVEKATADKMISHEEIRTIITAFGTGIDEEFDLDKLRYHRIILMTDADVDGAHIRTLLLTFFFRHMADLIKAGHLYVGMPPLYRVGKGKAVEWVYSDAELNNILLNKKLEDVSIHSVDDSVRLTGRKLSEMLDSFRMINMDLDKLERELGISPEFTKFLLMMDKSLHRIEFSSLEDMEKIRQWFENLGIFKTRSEANPIENEYWLEIGSNNGKSIRLDKRLLENPILRRCVDMYPQVKELISEKRYIIFKKEKEIARDIPSERLLEELDKLTEKSGLVLQRYKGLGEMSAEQLWQTTMDPEKRTLLQVDIEDASRADEIFHVLMGNEVAPRKAFIQRHASSVTNIDI